MNYTEKYFELKTKFKSQCNYLSIDDSMDMVSLPFCSENHWLEIFEENKYKSHELFPLGVPDSNLPQNNQFAYTVFVPKGKAKYAKAIILLHGLNERFWDKYLPWAYFLALYTKRPVILFPLSFHMNRAPMDWSNPKLMAPFVDKRKSVNGADNLTFVNVALSSRLSDEPLRFMQSGYQSAEDLIQLSNQMEQGLVSFFEKGTKPDFFAYSIGAFVSQILLLANPNGMFSDSRFFLFCGGAMFKDMNGISKLIMDKVAFEKLIAFYTVQMDDSNKDRKVLSEFLAVNPLGKAFYSMLKADNNKIFREEKFEASHNNIYSVSLQKDKVIPSLGINYALSFNEKRKEMAEILDFPYEYKHENPFPVAGKWDSHMVDFWFTEVILKAAKFLN